MCNTITPEEVAELEFQLGPTLVAVCANNRNKSAVQPWLEGTKTPTKEEAQRLSLALELFRQVAQSEGSDLARSWFIGDNATCGSTPAMAIRANKFDIVRTAAQRFIAGTDGY